MTTTNVILLSIPLWCLVWIANDIRNYIMGEIEVTIKEKRNVSGVPKKNLEGMT